MTSNGEWCTYDWQVLKTSRHRATSQHTTDVLLLAYDLSVKGTNASIVKPGVCNASRIDGMVCRMPAGHDGQHVPFTGELICTTGVYVVDRIEK